MSHHRCHLHQPTELSRSRAESVDDYDWSRLRRARVHVRMRELSLERNMSQIFFHDELYIDCMVWYMFLVFYFRDSRVEFDLF